MKLKKYVFWTSWYTIFVSLCHLISGDTKDTLTLFVCKKKYPPSTIGVIVVEKIGGKMKELATIGVAYNQGGGRKFCQWSKRMDFQRRIPTSSATRFVWWRAWSIVTVSVNKIAWHIRRARLLRLNTWKPFWRRCWSLTNVPNKTNLQFAPLNT